jgi:hypothetical protein
MTLISTLMKMIKTGFTAEDAEIAERAFLCCHLTNSLFFSAYSASSAVKILIRF